MCRGGGTDRRRYTGVKCQLLGRAGVRPRRRRPSVTIHRPALRAARGRDRQHGSPSTHLTKLRSEPGDSGTTADSRPGRQRRWRRVRWVGPASLQPRGLPCDATPRRSRECPGRRRPRPTHRPYRPAFSGAHLCERQSARSRPVLASDRHPWPARVVLLPTPAARYRPPVAGPVRAADRPTGGRSAYGAERRASVSTAHTAASGGHGRPAPARPTVPPGARLHTHRQRADRDSRQRTAAVEPSARLRRAEKESVVFMTVRATTAR